MRIGRNRSLPGEHPDSQRFTHGHLSRVTIRLLVTLAITGLSLGAFSSMARSDIGACSGVAPPRNHALALRRAGFAFDGIVVSGRGVTDPRTGADVLASPLVFRVVRDLKGRMADYGRVTTSGQVLIRVWDAKYFSTALRQRIHRHEGPHTTLPGELATVRGALWRIYALQEESNWTSKNCLGSYLLREPRPHNTASRSPAAPRDTTSEGPSTAAPAPGRQLRSDSTSPWVWTFWGLASVAAIAAVWSLAVRVERRRSARVSRPVGR